MRKTCDLLFDIAPNICIINKINIITLGREVRNWKIEKPGSRLQYEIDIQDTHRRDLTC